MKRYTVEIRKGPLFFTESPVCVDHVGETQEEAIAAALFYVDFKYPIERGTFMVTAIWELSGEVTATKLTLEDTKE